MANSWPRLRRSVCGVGIRLLAGDPEIYGARPARNGRVTVHFGGRVDSREFGLHVWGGGAPPTDWAVPLRPDGADRYGPYWTLPVRNPAAPIWFVVHRSGEKDPADDLSLLPTARREVWVRSGGAQPYPTRAAAENRAVLHYRRPDRDYEGWGLRVWAGAEPTEWEEPLEPVGFDGLGAVFEVALDAGATELAYVLHRGDRKDLDADQRLDLAAVGHEVWLTGGDDRFHVPVDLADAPPRDLTESWAVWIDRKTVAARVPTADRYELRFDSEGKLSIVDGMLVGGETIRLRRAGLLRPGQRRGHPHLWRYSAFRVHPHDRDLVAAALRSRVVFAATDGNDDSSSPRVCRPPARSTTCTVARATSGSVRCFIPSGPRSRCGRRRPLR